MRNCDHSGRSVTCPPSRQWIGFVKAEAVPTFIRQNGFEVMIHTDDHSPAHVHCYRGRRLVKVRLNDLTAYHRTHATDRDVNEALRIVAEHRDLCWEAWRQIHGDD